MTMRITDTILNAAVNLLADAPDAGAGANGLIRFYSGTPPATLTGAPAGTLLAEVDLQDPAFNAGGTTNVGEAEALGVPLATTGLAAGTIGWARILDTDGLNADTLWDEDDVDDTGTPAILVNTLTVSVGVAFEVVSYVLSAVPQT
jgi:hypothetical protein